VAKNKDLKFNDILMQLRKGEVKPLYVLEGEEEYLKEKLIKSIEKILIDPAAKEIDFVSINCSEKNQKITPEYIKNEISTPAFISKRKLVVIKNSGLFGSNKKSESKNEISKDLENLINYIPESVCLVFSEKKVDKRQKSIVEAIHNKGVLADISKPDIRTIRTWVVKELDKSGIKIDANACDIFIERNESVLLQMTGELEKLVLYSKSQGVDIITSIDVENIGISDLKGSIFDLTDSLSKLNAQEAYRILDVLIMQKQPLPLISFMIARHFRQLIIAKDINDISEITKKLKVMPFVANKLFYQSRKFSVDSLDLIYNECYESEVSVKTSKINDRISIETLFAFIIEAVRTQ